MPFDLRDGLIVIVHIALAIVGIRLVAIDAREHRLPNRIVLSSLVALFVLLVADALIGAETTALFRAVWGMLLLGGFYALLRVVSKGGIGGGDVKLAAVIGLLLAWHGWEALALGTVAAFVLGALFALILMAMRRADRKTRIAFGPWMIIGAVAGIALV